MSSFTIDTSDVIAAAAALEAVDEVLEPIAGDVVDDMATTVQQAVRREARRHRATGRLEQNVRIVDASKAGMRSRATVKATGSVAPIIIGGQAPHVIRARRARALQFAGPPQAFAASVRHPGTAPDPFFARGVRVADLDTITDRAAARAADQLATAADGG